MSHRRGWARDRDVELGHLAAVTGLALAVDGPPPRVGGHRLDGGADLVVHPGADRELDVAGGQRLGEGRHVAGGVGAHHDGVHDGVGRIAGVVAGLVFGGELGERQVEHSQLVGAGVGVGVAGAQDPRQRLTGVVSEAEHGVKAVAALEVAGGRLLVLGVHLDQRRVHVEGHLLRRLHRPPHPFASRRPGAAQAVEHRRVDSRHSPPDRRRGGHVAEPLGPITQRRHVGDALSAAGQHHRHLGQHTTTIVARGPLARPRHSRRVGRSQPGAVGQFPEKVQPDLGGDLAVSRHHPDTLDCVGSVHLVGALLVGFLDASTTSESLATRASPRMLSRQRARARERSGLVAPRPTASAAGVPHGVPPAGPTLGVPLLRDSLAIQCSSSTCLHERGHTAPASSAKRQRPGWWHGPRHQARSALDEGSGRRHDRRRSPPRVGRTSSPASAEAVP